LKSKDNQKEQERLAILPKGGDAMSAFEIVMIIIGTVTLFMGLIKIMIELADKFSQRK